ncbi:hypothetical protein U1Q18_032542, partial [Sarracenia purpurea var. burkii]
SHTVPITLPKEPRSGLSIMEEALKIHGDLKKILKDKPMDENLAIVLRYEKVTLVSALIDF